MTRYILLFPTEQQLHAFTDQLGGKYTEINIRTLTLICECSPREVELAVQRYQAQVVKEEVDQ